VAGAVVPEQVQMHEPILTISDAAKLQSEFEFTYEKLSKIGVPINLVRSLFLPLPCPPTPVHKPRAACLSNRRPPTADVIF
jgi:hypothetical protein